ncbi:MAG: ZIP family metal transporter [Minisyncoccia bacterium]
MTEVLLYSVLVMLASLVGVFAVWRNVGRLIERNLSLLVSLSAGVFVVITYNLMKETMEHSSGVTEGLAWILGGAFFFWLLFKLAPLFHHHHDASRETTPHSRIDARRVMAGDALHNFSDGLLLAASFGVSSAFGVLTALSIFVHELVQEMSEFFVLKQAGYQTKKALISNFAISSTILLGSLVGFFLIDNFEMFEVPLLGLTAGAFLVVVLDDLIPHSIRASRLTQFYARHLAWFVIGLVLMFVVSSFVTP